MRTREKVSTFEKVLVEHDFVFLDTSATAFNHGGWYEEAFGHFRKKGDVNGRRRFSDIDLTAIAQKIVDFNRIYWFLPD